MGVAVRQIAPEGRALEELLKKVDDCRVCLEISKSVNPAILTQLVNGIIPTTEACIAETSTVTDYTERITALKACFLEKEDVFVKSSEMTAEDREKFVEAGKCVYDKLFHQA
ncbi:hypothetical protein HPB47_024121 [Ixodes persulcatus]|uniref:Uncharacterized protein n=1 Tax=Ixodes persulcatus TaxID=34615 RepID=A0AC60Q7L4_IXOPE|nr:hypothetical protein HPB47_024121 [Ixodes persulcatus]